jgi:TP901 family phage tail tape measure protein
MFDAGSITTTLRGQLDKSEFERYDAANKRAVASAERAEAEMSAAQERYQKALRQTNRVQQEGTAASRKAALAQSEQASAVARNQAETARLEKAIRSSGVATKLQATELDRLGKQHAVLSSAMNESARATQFWSRNNEQAGKNLHTLGNVTAKGAAVGILALGAATIYAAKTAGDFEKQMRNVNSIAKLSEQGYHDLSNGVLSLAGETAQAPKVLAEGLYQLVSSGFNASDSLTILKSSAKAATAGLTDTATATTAVAAVLNAYREPASKASSVSDILFETVNRGVLTFAELSKEIGTVLPFAASLGVTLPEVGASISTMTKEGISAPETMTRIKQAMVSIIKPSVDMKKAIAETGASSGQALIKQKGFQGGLEALLKTTDGSKESMAKLFPNIRALGGVLALTGHNAKSAQGDLKAFGDTSGATQKVFDEQAKGAEFAAKKLSSSFKRAAIVVGYEVLPLLAREAGKFGKSLEQAANDGSLKAFGHDLVSGLETTGHVIGDATHVVEALGGALKDVGRVLDIGPATGIEAFVAAFATFKSLDFVLPILFAAGAAVKALGAAVAEGGLASLPGALMALDNPVGLIAGGAALAAGAVVLLSGALNSGSSAAEKNAAALEADKAAMESLNKAVTDAAKGEIEAKQAALDHKNALAELSKDEKLHSEGKLSDTQLEQAHINVLRTGIGVQESTRAALEKVEKVRKQAEKREGTASKRSGELQEEKQSLEESIAIFKASGASRQDLADKLHRLGSINDEYSASLKRQAQAMAEVAVAEISRNRQQHNEGAIKPENALGVNDLQITLSGLPKKVVTKYELADEGTIAKLGRLSNALEQAGKGTVVVKVLTTAHSAAAALAGLKAVANGVPTRKVISILHNAPSAKSAITQLHGAISAVPPSKRIAISTNSAAAESELRGVQAAVDAIHGKSVFVNITKAVSTVESIARKAVGTHASGRSSGDREAAMVGEGQGREYVVDRTTGRGTIVEGPTLMGLGQDDYVIPLEERYRGRALGLFAMLAKDLEVPGYAKGKAPAKPKGGAKAHHPMPVPDAIRPLSLPLTDIEKKRDDAKTAEGHAKSKVKSEESKIHSLEKSIRTASRAKKPDHAKLREYRDELAKQRAAHEHDSKELAKDKQALKEWNRTVREARQFAAKIKHVELEVSNDRNAMQLAAGRDDFGAYTDAKNKRIHDLGRLAGLIQEARDKVKTGSDYALELEGQIQQAQLEAGATAAEEPETAKDKAAEEEESTGMTASERAEQARIERDVALAALTPDLGDDTSRARELVSFFGKVLGEVQAEPGPRGGDTAIKQAAEAYKQAQNNLASLAGGSATNDNSDLQAQIDQKNQQLEVAKQGQQIAERALETFGGSGDIGAGGRNAAGAAAGVTIIQNNLHPGDPSVLRAIGDAATAGIGLQGSRQAVRVRVGP